MGLFASKTNRKEAGIKKKLLIGKNVGNKDLLVEKFSELSNSTSNNKGTVSLRPSIQIDFGNRPKSAIVVNKFT
mgnify:FL=1